MQFRQLRTFVYKATAGSMAIWLSGIVLLFCCNEMEGGVTEVGPHDQTTMSAHCRAESDAGSPAVQNQSTEHEAFDCCGFIPVLLDKVRKVESNEQVVVVAPSVVVERPVLTPRQYVSPFPISYRPVALLRSDTYLKNRTFRI